MMLAFVGPTGLVLSLLGGAPDDWPDLRDAGVLHPCGEDVGLGWRWNGKGFEPPAPAARVRVITPLEFRRRLTPAERAAIALAAWRSLEHGDATLQLLLDDLHSSSNISLDADEQKHSLEILKQANLLSDERVQELLA